jgi:tight adherence protein B
VTTYLVAGLVWVAVAAGVAGLAPLVARLWVRPRVRLRKRMEREFGRTKSDESIAVFKDLHQVAKGTNADGPPSFRIWFVGMVERSGLGITPKQLLRIASICAVAFGAAAGLAKRSELFAVAGALGGAVLPVFYVRHRAMKRDEKLLAQLPEVLDLATRFLKAGHSLPQALGAVTQELKGPARELFARYVSQRDLGLPMEVTLRELADRAGLTEYRIVTMAILVQQQSGGNLADVCERLASVVRERFRVKGMIRALTAEGRMQASILMALPPGLVLLMMVVKPTYADAMLSQPKLIAGILISQLIGVLWIRKIVNVKF